MGSNGSGPKNPVRTAQTTLRIVEALKMLDGATVTELAERLDLPKSSAHNYLRTLEHEGYVVKNGRTYEVGLRFLDLGAYARANRPLYRVAKPQIRQLAEDSGELINLMIEEHGRGVLLHREKGRDAVSIDSFAGQNVHLHTTALGKTILAYLPSERVDEIIGRHGLPAKTTNTITDRDELYEELDRIEEDGVAFDHEERIKGLGCVAVPILSDDRVEGAISVSGPISRIGVERMPDELLDSLRNAANIVELNQTYS